jgi:hypothetical protein
MLLGLLAMAAGAQAGDIDGRAVVGGAVGGGAGAAVGSAVGGREGAVIGAGVGAAAGAAIATQPAPAKPKVVERRVVESEVVVVHDDDCWPPGHCKHKGKRKDKHRD